MNGYARGDHASDRGDGDDNGGPNRENNPHDGGDLRARLYLDNAALRELRPARRSFYSAQLLAG